MRPILCILAMLAGTAAAADGDPDRGAELFARNCAVCHGADATGDGPMTQILSITPADLTRLASDNGYDLAEITRRIDGRDVILAHGGPMPLFGHILGGESAVVDGADGAPVFTTQAVLDIATWLVTIQR